jgi:hypothetical protein
MPQEVVDLLRRPWVWLWWVERATRLGLSARMLHFSFLLTYYSACSGSVLVLVLDLT